MYYRIDMNVQKYDDMDILDGIAITILPKAGFDNADLMKNPLYSPLLDDRMKSEVEKFKNSEV